MRRLTLAPALALMMIAIALPGCRIRKKTAQTKPAAVMDDGQLSSVVNAAIRSTRRNSSADSTALKINPGAGP